MNKAETLKLAEKVIETMFDNSTCKEEKYSTDRIHSIHTRKWVLRLKPNASIELQIAALGHDIDRTNDLRRIRSENYEDYEEYKKEHALLSAEILGDELIKHGIDLELVDKVKRIVEKHEVGGDEESDILKVADSLSFFEDNIELYYRTRGRDRTKFKIKFMYERLPDYAKDIIREIKFESKEIVEIEEEVFSSMQLV
jgi:hypothetical protein